MSPSDSYFWKGLHASGLRVESESSKWRNFKADGRNNMESYYTVQTPGTNISRV